MREYRSVLSSLSQKGALILTIGVKASFGRSPSKVGRLRSNATAAKKWPRPATNQPGGAPALPTHRGRHR